MSTAEADLSALAEREASTARRRRYRPSTAEEQAAHRLWEATAAAKWTARAACRGSAADFFPTTDAGAECAKAICAGCQVREDCLAFALETRQRDGVWGGMDETERHHYRGGWPGRFADAIRQAGLTRTQTATQLGVGVTTVLRWVYGHTDMPEIARQWVETVEDTLGP